MHFCCRYKLFLSNILNGRYKNIADRVNLFATYGGDHCQLLGGSENEAMTSPTAEDCIITYGEQRHKASNFLSLTILSHIQSFVKCLCQL